MVDKNKQLLIGVCVGSHGAEVVDYISLEVDDDGRRLEERRVKVEQIGIAENILPLLSWKPEMLEGKSLGAAISPSG